MIKAQARCTTDTSILSGWSGTLSVTIIAPETVSTPSTLSGPTSGTLDISYAYSTGGSASNYGHPIEYQFDWKGDGTDLSLWGSGTQSKTWTMAGTYNVRARARCKTDNTLMSSWSSGLTVIIAVPEVISIPDVPLGSAGGLIGMPYSYITGRSSSNYGHSVQYLFDWADGTNSGWLPVNTTTAMKIWTSTGVFEIRAKARCPIDTNVESEWSDSIEVTIFAVGIDLSGSWTTPLTQSCKTIGKNQRCSLKGTFTASNVGNKDAPSTTVKFYLSDNTAYEEGDTQLKSVATGKLKPGKSKDINFNLNLATNQTATGKYVIAVIDKGNLVTEIDKGNNIIVYGPIP